jgi:citrate lyase subunit beta/citryl-CoA lyase
MTSPALRPRRSVLYMPGANERAMDKARTLDCDGIIFDLEDAVAAGAKSTARQSVERMVSEGGYGHRELVVRVNGLDTPWGPDDVAMAAGLPVHALLFPKVERAAQLGEIEAAVDAAGGTGLPLWVMIETPLGVLDVREVVAGSDRVRVLVMGTSDLVKELRATHIESRQNLSLALQHCLLVARAAGLDILDGVHLDFRKLDSFEAACRQGRAMGFDGKTLIHPSQIDLANSVFGFSGEAVADARAVLEVWQAAQAAGKGVAELDGRLIENLHAAEAERVLAFAAALEARNSTQSDS